MGTEPICYERMHMNLKKLGLVGLSEQIDGYLEDAASKETGYVELVDQLLEEEVRVRRERTCETKVKLARFPFRKSIESFEFSFQPSVDKRQVKELLSLRFMAEGKNIVFLGPPGVGKTHLAVAIGMSACQSGHSVYFTTAEEMVDSLTKAASSGRYESRMRFLVRTGLLIVDELGYLPLEREASNLVFALISRRYEQGSPIILTSNRSYAEWGSMFSDAVIATAVLDRLLHRSVTVNIRGESYRLKDKRKAGVMSRTDAQERGL